MKPTLHTLSIRLLTLGITGSLLMACGNGKSDTVEGNQFFSTSLQKIKGSKPADLTGSKRSALDHLGQGTETNFSYGNDISEGNDLIGYGPKNFRNLKEFLLSTARTASQPGQEETRVKNLDLLQKGECMPYAAEENPELAGDVTPAVQTEMDFKKVLIQGEGEKVIEDARFSANAKWSIKLNNCRSKDWDIQTQMVEALGYTQGYTDEYFKKDEAIMAKIAELHSQIGRLEETSEVSDEIDSQIQALKDQIDALRAERTELDITAEENSAKFRAAYEVLTDEVTATINRDGTIKGTGRVLIEVTADPKNRKSYYDMKEPDYDDQDFRFKQALEDVEGTIQAESTLEGTINVSGFDEASASLVNHKVSADALILGIQISPLDLADLQSMMINDILTIEKRKEGVRDIIENSVLCSGSIKFDDKSTYTCAAIAQMYLQEVLDEAFEEEVSESTTDVIIYEDETEVEEEETDDTVGDE